MTESPDYIVTVTGPNGEIIYTHAAPISDEYRQQAIREFLQALAKDRPIGSYFLLGVDSDGTLCLMDVTDMVQSAIRLADAQRGKGC